MAAALEPSVPRPQSEDLRRWLLLTDGVLSHQAAFLVGIAGLTELCQEYVDKGDYFKAASAKFSSAKLCAGASFGGPAELGAMKEANELLEKSDSLASLEGQQLRFDILSRYTFSLQLGGAAENSTESDELARVNAARDAVAKNPGHVYYPFLSISHLSSVCRLSAVPRCSLQP